MDQPQKLEISLSPSILDRYVAREFITGYLVSLGVVLGLRMVLDMFITFDEFIESGDGQRNAGAIEIILNIVDYYGPKLLEYFRDFSGTIILIAAAFSLVRMARQNELAAIMASGQSLKRMIVPVVFLGIFFNLLMVADQEFVIPAQADRLVLDRDEAGGKLTRYPLWLVPDRDGSLLNIREFDPQTGCVTGLLVIFRKEGTSTAILSAAHAVWNDANAYWDLDEGWLLADDGSGRQSAAAYSSNLSPKDLLLQRNKNFKTLLSWRQLTDLLKRGELKDADHRATLNEKHFRFTDPIINMVMLLLGLPMLVSRDNRTVQSKTALLLAMAGPAGCFVLTFACKIMGADLMDPMLAAWLPIIVFTPLSIIAIDSLKT